MNEELRQIRRKQWLSKTGGATNRAPTHQSTAPAKRASTPLAVSIERKRTQRNNASDNVGNLASFHSTNTNTATPTTSPFVDFSSFVVAGAAVTHHHRQHNSNQHSSSANKSLTPEMGRIRYPNSSRPHLTLDSFLETHPPTNDVPGCHWIQVDNPNRSSSSTSDGMDDIENADSAAGMADVVAANNTNSNLGANKIQHQIMCEFASYGEKRITKSMKRECMNLLCEAATLTSGKWMLFPSPDKVDFLWNSIARKVVNGELNCAAKVSNDSSARAYLICVYVDDFRDAKEVRKVLRVLLRTRGAFVKGGFKVCSNDVGHMRGILLNYCYVLLNEWFRVHCLLFVFEFCRIACWHYTCFIFVVVFPSSWP